MAKEKMTKQEGQAWGGLRRAWIGYTIARANKNKAKMRYYAEGILKFKKILGIKGKAKPVPKRMPKYVNGLMHRKKTTGKIVIEGLI